MPADIAIRAARLAHVRGVYLVTPDVDDSEFAGVLKTVGIALAAGVTVVQYRNKRAEPQTRHRQARRLLLLAHSLGALCIINDDVSLAVEIGADGAHVGSADGDPGAARAILGDRLLGVSCYDSGARAREAVMAGADMIAFGSLFRSSTKPGAVYAPLARLTEARAVHPSSCVIGIGGITVENIAAAAAAGAQAAAVIQAVFGAVDPAAAVRLLQEQFALGLAIHESQRTTV
jgi:thiamine-phosphate pyrophosphorylase